MQRTFVILTSLAGLNTATFAICYFLASADNGSEFAGLIPALIVYVTIFVSMLLTAFVVYYYKKLSAKTLLSTLLALLPVLFRIAWRRHF
jgi:hypothetical protein